MKKFKVKLSGVSANGTNWIILERTNGIFLQTCVLRTVEPVKVGTEVEVPADIKLDWN